MPCGQEQLIHRVWIQVTQVGWDRTGATTTAPKRSPGASTGWRRCRQPFCLGSAGRRDGSGNGSGRRRRGSHVVVVAVVAAGGMDGEPFGIFVVLVDIDIIMVVLVARGHHVRHVETEQGGVRVQWEGSIGNKGRGQNITSTATEGRRIVQQMEGTQHHGFRQGAVERRRRGKGRRWGCCRHSRKHEWGETAAVIDCDQGLPSEKTQTMQRTDAHKTKENKKIKTLRKVENSLFCVGVGVCVYLI